MMRCLECYVTIEEIVFTIVYDEDYWPDEWQHWYCDEEVETSKMKAIVEAAPCAMYRDHSGYDEDPNYFVLRASIHDSDDPRGAPELPPDV
ncbi:hypothetical protein LCGC14_1770460, partial [marine sediment metagenome]